MPLAGFINPASNRNLKRKAIATLQSSHQTVKPHLVYNSSLIVHVGLLEGNNVEALIAMQLANPWVCLTIQGKNFCDICD
jgi:hypothetical protein